jgi:Cupin domain
MTKVSKESAERTEHGPVTEWRQDADGYTIDFVQFHVDIDGTPLLKGLPDNRCSCPHWGYVVTGRATFRFGDREEVYEAGDAFYTPPGHIPVMAAGTECVMFSPSEELAQTEEVMARNMRALA